MKKRKNYSINQNEAASYLRRQKGFTLIELLISMVVGLVVIAAIYGIYTTQNKELSRQEQIAEMQQNARIAIYMISNELVMAGYGPQTLRRCVGSVSATNAPCVGITAANANSVSFTTDLNGNGVTTADTSNPNENITYDIYTEDGIPSLSRISNGVRQSVVDNITSLTFTYLTSAGATTSNLAQISKIQISLIARTQKIDPQAGDYHYFTLTSDVAPRNLGKTGF